MASVESIERAGSHVEDRLTRLELTVQSWKDLLHQVNGQDAAYPPWLWIAESQVTEVRNALEAYMGAIARDALPIVRDVKAVRRLG